jgi:DnaJ homolog subfamily A member 2
MNKHITLVEALIGFEFPLKHLDDQVYNIYTARGEVTADKTRKVVRGLGMPFLKSHSDHGNLIIDFKVDMPKRGELSKEQIEVLSALLPGKVNERPKGDYHMLDDFDKEGVNTSEEGGKKNMEDEDEEESGGVGCQSQ